MRANQDPEEAKGLVERKVVRIVTPGTVIESSILDEKSNNYLLSIFRYKDTYGLACVDVSTGDFSIMEIIEGNTKEKVMNELARIQPSEILVNEALQKTLIFRSNTSSIFFFITPWHEWAYQKENAYQVLSDHFNVQSLEAYGCENMPYGISAAGALFSYLSETQKAP